MIWPILEARAEIGKYFRFLVQMKTSKFAFDINWPLVIIIYGTKTNIDRIESSSLLGK